MDSLTITIPTENIFECLDEEYVVVNKESQKRKRVDTPIPTSPTLSELWFDWCDDFYEYTREMERRTPYQEVYDSDCECPDCVRVSERFEEEEEDEDPLYGGMVETDYDDNFQVATRKGKKMSRPTFARNKNKRRRRRYGRRWKRSPRSTVGGRSSSPAGAIRSG